MAKYRKLGRTAGQRKALLRNQVTALLNNGKIVTTEAKAKEIRKIAEGLIAMAVREKDNYDEVTVTAKVARKDKDGKRVKEVVDGKKVTVYDEVEKKIKKDQPSRLHARREMLKVLYFSSAGYDFPLDDCVQTAKMAPDHHWRHLLDLARETCGMRDDGTPLKNSLLRLLTQEVVTVLMSRSFREKAAPPQWLAESVEEMKKKNNYAEGLPRLISLSGRTQEHLCRSMKKYYGISPQEYVISLRLEDAASQLLHTGREVSTIAFDVGFHNLSYFRRCFLRRYGTTPLKYRARFRIMRH